MNNNKLVKRTYFLAECELCSPMHNGSGGDEFSNLDVMKNYKGEPFLSGTSIAGTFRHWLAAVEGKQTADNLFGAELREEQTISNSSESDFAREKQFHQSRIFVSNGIFTVKKTAIRDHVMLKDKVAVPQAKFDMEVIPAGSRFLMRFEIIEREEDKENYDEEVMKSFFQAIQNGEICFGGKVNRGYGKINVKKIWKRAFEYPADAEDWLEWNGKTDEEKWLDNNKGTADQTKCILPLPAPMESSNMLRLQLNIPQTLLIRDVRNIRNLEMDFTYITENGRPVIPGTTWAGAFRQRLQTIVQDLKLTASPHSIVELLFGAKHGSEDSKPSILQFEESVITEGKEKTVTRTAIDRFSGGTVDGALFTGQVLYGGNTELVIRWRKTNEVDCTVIKGILYWLIRDLHEGLLAIGGETSIGRGIVNIKDYEMLEDLKAGKAVMEYLKKGEKRNDGRN